MLLLMNSRIVSKLFDKVNDRIHIDYYTTPRGDSDNDKNWIYKQQTRQNRKFYNQLITNIYCWLTYLMMSVEKCYYFFKSMSHPSTYMGTGHNQVTGRNMDGEQLTGPVDHSTQTSSYGSIPHDRSSYISVNERTPLLGRRPANHGSGINIGVLALGVLLIGGATIGTYLLIIEDRPYETSFPFDLVYRESWNAADNIYRGDKTNHSLTQNVYIAHTGGSSCIKFEECIRIVKNLQNDSIYRLKNDFELPYNFLIGSDGKTYEVRGWDYEMGYESIVLDPKTSLLIGLIGNYTQTSPDRKQIEEIKSLLSVAQRRNKLWKNYNVYGIRNVSISLVDGTGFISTLQKKLDHFRYIIDVT